MASTLKKTAVAGGLLGLALLTFLKTKKGRIIKDRLKEHTQDLYTEAEEKLREFGNSSKEKYDEAVAALVRQYSQKKMLATETVVDLTRELQKKWKVFQLHYLYEKLKSNLPDSKTEINQTGFNSAADDIATEYGKEKQLAKAEIADLLDSLKKKWKEFKAELA